MPARARTRTNSNSRAWIREHRIAFTVNLVVHRQNIDHLEEMIAALEALHPDRMEIAHAQYYGWALQESSALLPTRAQLDRAVAVVAAAEERLRGKVRIDMVVPDYHARFPKACMGGWGRQLMLIDPAGRALPCHAAGVIPGMRFDNVREHSARLDLAELRGIPEISRRRLDARALPLLRPPQRRFRRMPLPGISADGRCERDRSGVRACAVASCD